MSLLASTTTSLDERYGIEQRHTGMEHDTALGAGQRRCRWNSII